MDKTPLNSFGKPHLITPPQQASPSRYAAERKLVDLLIKHFPHGFRNKSILDIGCGWGEYRFLFSGAQYLGIDVADFGYAEKRSINADFKLMDATEIGLLQAAFDLILINYALEYFSNEQNILGKLSSRLKPSGKIVFTVPGYWVLTYEWPALIYSLIGKPRTIVASKSVRHYTKKKLIRLTSAEKFDIKYLSSSSGLLTSLLKLTIVSYNFVKLAMVTILSSLGHILPSGIRGYCDYQKRHISLLPQRTVRNAINYQELKKIWNRAQNSLSRKDRLYCHLLSVSYNLDEKVFPFFYGEYIVMCDKLFIDISNELEARSCQ